jgi:hypothetical protein
LDGLGGAYDRKPRGLVTVELFDGVDDLRRVEDQSLRAS